MMVDLKAAQMVDWKVEKSAVMRAAWLDLNTAVMWAELTAEH